MVRVATSRAGDGAGAPRRSRGADRGQARIGHLPHVPAARRSGRGLRRCGRGGARRAGDRGGRGAVVAAVPWARRSRIAPGSPDVFHARAPCPGLGRTPRAARGVRRDLGRRRSRGAPGPTGLGGVLPGGVPLRGTRVHVAAHLEGHHVRYRSRGGDDSPGNRLCLCRFHHKQGEHGGLASCRGVAPLQVDWRLGAHDVAVRYRNDRRLA